MEEGSEELLLERRLALDCTAATVGQADAPAALAVLSFPFLSPFRVHAPSPYLFHPSSEGNHVPRPYDRWK